MKKKLISGLVVCGLLVGGFFLLRTQVVWLDFFDGTILAKVEDQVATVMEGSDGQRRSKFHLEVETDSGRVVKVPVDQLTYFDAGRGMRIRKSPFTSSVELLGP